MLQCSFLHCLSIGKLSVVFLHCLEHAHKNFTRHLCCGDVTIKVI